MKLRFFFFLFPMLLAACSSPTESTPIDAGEDVTDADAADVLDFSDARRAYGCTEAAIAANDRTADGAERIVHLSTTSAPAQFTPNCMRIRVGQTLEWVGDVSDHPLEVDVSGTIVGVIGAPDGSPDFLSVAPKQAGVIEFHCEAHPTIEYGSIEVVP